LLPLREAPSSGKFFETRPMAERRRINPGGKRNGKSASDGHGQLILRREIKIQWKKKKGHFILKHKEHT
jgi:hypothetical protein